MARKMTGMSPEAVARNQRRAAQEVRMRAERLLLDPSAEPVALQELHQHRWWMAFTPQEAARYQLLWDERHLMPMGLFADGLAVILKRRVNISECGAENYPALWRELVGRDIYPSQWRRTKAQMMGELRLILGW